MNYSAKSRLYMSIVVLVMLLLIVMPISILLDLQNTRYSALTDCIKDNFYLFDFCYKKSHEDITLSLLNFSTPFVPAATLIWLSWLVKVDFQIDANPPKFKVFRKVAFYGGCIVGCLGVFAPFFIVFEKPVDTLYKIAIHDIFLMPWLAISWLCAPIVFQKLLDSQSSMGELIRLRKLALVTLIAPFAAIFILFMRQILKM